MKEHFFNNRFLSIQDRQIFVQEKSLDSPIVIVFIHGRCLSVRSWERQFDSQLLAPFGLVAFDLPGHGLSERTSDLQEYSLEGSVQLLINLIDQLQLTNFILAGHSLGGHIALQALPKLANCRGVFCMTMPLTKPISFDQMYLNGYLLTRVYQPNPQPANLSVYIDSLLRPTVKELPRFIEDDFQRTDPVIHAGIMQGLLSGNYQDETEIIRTSKVPVAIVQGALEQVHNLAYLKTLDLPLWLNQPQIVPLAGHLLQWENPELVNQMIRRFLAEI